MMLSDSYIVRLAQVRKDLRDLNATRRPGPGEQRVIAAAMSDVDAAIEKLTPITIRRVG